MQRPLIIGRPTIIFDTIDSTNDYATLLVSNSNPNEGTVIWAHYQSKGRGQIGSNWEATPGESLLMSVILQPRFLLASQQFTLNILASLAVKAALNQFGINAKIKWPNDIYVGNLKICGILVQNILQGKSIKNAIVGIGLNINQNTFDPLLPNPTSMRLVTQQLSEIAEVKAEVCKQLQYYYSRLKEDGYEVLKKEYNQHLYRRNECHKYSVADTEIEGIILGISEIGKLQIETDGSIQEYNFREIKYKL